MKRGVENREPGVEPAVPEGESFYRGLVEDAAEAFLTVDQEGTVVHASQAVERILGYEPTALVGRPLPQLVPKRLRARHREGFERYVRGGDRGLGVGDPTPLTALHADGHEVPVEVRLHEHEERGLVTAIVRDNSGVTPEHRQAALREQLLTDLLEHSPDILWLFRGAFDELLYINAAYERMWGHPVELVRDDPLTFFDAIHPEDRTTAMEAVERLAEGEPIDIEIRVNPREEFGRWAWIRATPVFDGDRSDGGPPDRIAGFTRDITDRKCRERTLARQRNSLERVQQLTRSLRPLNRRLARATTSEEIQTLLVRELASSEIYQFAGYGEYDAVEERLVPAECDGIDTPSLPELDLSSADDRTPDGLVARAVTARGVRTTGDLLEDPPSGSWHELATEWGCKAVAAVPVSFDGTVHAVILVGTGRADAFDEYECDLLYELGERVGHAIDAAASKRLLNRGTVVELESRITDASFPMVGATRALDCRLELEAFLPAAGGGTISYLTVEGCDPAAVADYFEAEHAAVDVARVVDSAEDRGTVECRVGRSVAAALSTKGASIRSIVAEYGTATLVIETSPESDPYTVHGLVTSLYPETELVAKRTTERPLRGTGSIETDIRRALTGRQWEALELAYRSGFFESPRHSTGEELAPMLGISSPTFYQHVRRATQRLLEQLDDGDILPGYSATLDDHGR
ncbi:bacterio-opsin activator domain-containing protein [Haloglomus litoreum]|uniref:bacterio-opsin activator domain-containing protein n=1 Tax=Haloglomus litoreum TaxID=3034026 RepID=UPI0023E76ABC|nr:bacterio-opsin activator domain-containing protein [Haloglomus sp. DT116]